MDLKPSFFFRAATEKAARVDVAGGQAAVFSHKAPWKETENEDAAAVIPLSDTQALLMVADGLGGHRAGSEASKTAVLCVYESVQKAMKRGAAVREGIMGGIEEANKVIMALGLGSATTLCVVELDGKTIRPYHVGDSQIMVVGQRGKIKFQSLSHSPVGYAVEAGMLSEESALLHEDRHIVSNCIGDPRMTIDVGASLILSRRDTLLLASDGLCDNLTIGEVVELIRKGPLKKRMAQTQSACQTRMAIPEKGSPSKADDLTFLLFTGH